MSAIDENNQEENSIKIDQKFLIKVTNENHTIIDKSSKQNCKILQISSELDIDQKLSIIRNLEPLEYPNLFIFIMEHQNGNFLTENQDVLNKFRVARPLIIQQICEAENKTKFYYKGENSSEIVNIDQHYDVDYKLYEEWKNILSSLKIELQPFEDKLLKKLSNIKDSSIIFRFSRTLNLPESLFEILVRFIALNGSKADLLALLDASFEDNGRILSDWAQNYIKTVFDDDDNKSESSDASDEEDQAESTLEKASDEKQDDSVDGTSIKNKDSGQSILLTAVQNFNKDIIYYLITYWTPLIQQLPVEHQIRISTTAYDKNELDVLCDLLEISDFPFPKDFYITNNQLNHERLRQLIIDRLKLHEAIEQEDEKEIKDFIDNNLNPKFVYSPQNITAMKKAINLQKYKIYFYLKSFGLYAAEFSDLDQVLDEKELKKANDQANLQKTDSINDAILNASNSVLILCTKSLIHNRKVKMEEETKYRKRIKKWLVDIQKIESIMLDVAASCENLVIIFDFESKFVDRTAFSDVLGLSSDTVSSRIFIGAKLGDSKRDQEIKGVLANELCHYVMSLVYDNNFLPYCKHETDMRDCFDEIVEYIDRWSANDPEPPDDECDGIISSVFRYKKEHFNPELIARAVQILVVYDNDSEKSNYLQEKYRNLFEFWYAFVLPDFPKYLQRNQVVIRINTTVELLLSLSKSKIEFSESKDLGQLTKNKVTVVTTNLPKLLFVNIHKHLQKNFGCLLDSQNVFIEPEKIKIEQVWKDLMHLYTKDVKLNIFVDCTKGHLDNLSRILTIDEYKLILVASNEEQSTKLNEICIKKEIMPTSMDINYNWSDLTEECQIMLIQTKVTFQNNPKVSIMDVLSKNANPDQNEVNKVIEDFSNTINDHLFNLLIDRHEISINSNIEDSSIINFEILFRNRDFLKKGINFKNEISQEKLISITANNKYVLISDIAGSGKSWVVKNISKIIMKQYPTRWVTYVDLKQFIKEFKKEQPENLEFENYFIENILKPKTTFEEEIFKKLYKNGKVSLIFDAFDEIAPDCAEFVADLAKLFEFNNGNQLWIVTRDYFEVNLQQKLEIDNVYKLNDFTEEDGINFIVASWILMDLKEQKVNNFENHVQNSPNLTKYREKAKRIVQKVTTSKNQSIGLPQLFSMIAEGFKDDLDTMDDLKGAKIFTKFVQTMYNRMLAKGQLREDANAESLDYELNFKELHQYFAILSLLPELIDIFFPDYDISEWPEVEIIAGGIMNKIGSNYSFNHETFREYFVADFIFKAIKKSKIKKEIIDLLVMVLTIQKYGIIRMFLNDFIENDSKMDKVQLELEKSVEIFSKMENLSDYFTENLEHLTKLVIEVLKKGNKKIVKEILNDNISAVVTKTEELKMFSAFTEFLFSNLRVDDLKDMINSQNILHKMIGSESNVEIFEYFVLKLDEKVGREFIQQQLKLMPSERENGNIFYHLGSSKNLNENKVQKCLEIFQKYLGDDNIVELMEKCTEDEKTILKILVENTMNFKPFFEGVEYFFKNPNLFKKFKNIVHKTDSNDENILLWCAYERDIDYYTLLWNLIQKTFENYEELKKFVLQKNKIGYNFLHVQLIRYDKSETIEIILKKLKEILNESDYQEILSPKRQKKMNLLQIAAIRSKKVKTHAILWKELQASRKPDEFLELLGKVDKDSNPVIHVAAGFSNSEVFEFMEEELSKIASRDEIRKLLIMLGYENSNILQSAARHSKSLELHETLWKIIKKYLNSSEILEFIKNLDTNGFNLLIIVTEENSKKITELTWKEVKELLNSNGLVTEEHKENIQKCENFIKASSGPNYLKLDEREMLTLKWIKNEKSEVSKLFAKVQQASVERNFDVNKFESLKFFITDKNVENHKNLWKNLVKVYKNREDLKKLLLEKIKNQNCFIHLLVILNTAEVFEFTLQKYKENLSELDYQEFLRSKEGHLRRNLLQLAPIFSKEVKTHQILWKEFQNSCKSEEFLEILGEFDNEGNNVFNLAAAFATAEVFEFMEEKLSKIASRDEIRKLFIKLGNGNLNLLQTAILQNNSLEFHKMLWKILQNYFNPAELFVFVKNFNEHGDNLLIIARKYCTKEILQLTWTEVEKVLTNLYTDTENIQKIQQCGKVIQNIVEKGQNERTREEFELLKLEWIKKSNSESSNSFDKLTQYILRNNLNVRTLDDLMPIVFNKNVLNHTFMWERLLKTFENRQNLVKILLEKDKKGNNFIHLIVAFNTANVIDFTLKKLKENLNESNYQEIMRSKGQFGRNLLQNAACGSKELKIHRILWKTLRDSCESKEEFLEIIGEDDETGNNVLHLAVSSCTTSEFFEFIEEELTIFASRDEIRKLFLMLGLSNLNLLQSAAVLNKSLDLHKALWELIRKYFDSSEILHFFNHRDDFGDNLLLNVIKWNVKEVKELTWNKIRATLITFGYENNDNFKNCDELMKKEINKKLTKEEEQILKLDWIDCSNSVKLFEDSIKLLIQKDISEISLEDLMSFKADENVKNHRRLWKYLEQNIKSYEEFKKLLFEKDKNGNNFIHLLVIFNTAELIQFTINKLKENLNDSNYQEILRSKGQFGQNLIQLAAVNSKEVKTLWREIQNSCKSDEEFLEILKEIDAQRNNVFHAVSAISTSDVFEFMIAELEKLTNDQEVIKKLLSSFGYRNKNLLQLAANHNKSLEANKSVWKIICKYFEPEEILEFIEHCDEDDEKLICCAIYWNTKEIVEFTWSQIIIFLTSKYAQFEYLNGKGYKGKSLQQLSLENQANDPEVVVWVQQIIKEYEILIHTQMFLKLILNSKLATPTDEKV